MDRKERARSLWCPFASRMNPALEHAHAQSRAWGIEMGLLDGAEARRRFEAAAFARLTARAYPTAAVAELVLVAQWNLWLFVHDDGCDTAAAGRDPDALAGRYGELRGILRGASVAQRATPAVRAFAELVPRITAETPAQWRAHFVAMVDDYLAACVWEARNRAQARVPSVADYVRMRRDTGAVRTSLAMVERCERIELPPSVRRDPVVQSLADACNDVVCWANDIVSLDKELAHGDVHNLVRVVAHERCDGELAPALAIAARMHDDRVAEFIAISERLDPAPDGPLARFIDTLRAWMRGNLDWSLESGRYDSPA